jgi:hypothetical protein
MGDGYFDEHFYMSSKDIYISVKNTVLKAMSLDGSIAAIVLTGPAGNSLTIRDTVNFNNSKIFTTSGIANLVLFRPVETQIHMFPVNTL